MDSICFQLQNPQLTAPYLISQTSHTHSQAHSYTPTPKDKHKPTSPLVLTAQQPPAPPPKPLCVSAGCFLCSCTSRSARCIALNVLHTPCMSGSSGKQDLCSGKHNHHSTKQQHLIKLLWLECTKAKESLSTVWPCDYHEDGVLKPMCWCFLRPKCLSCSCWHRRSHTTNSSAALHEGNTDGWRFHSIANLLFSFSSLIHWKISQCHKHMQEVQHRLLLNPCCDTATTNALKWCYKIQTQITRLPIIPDLLKKKPTEPNT